jgi:hypothetical protein
MRKFGAITLTGLPAGEVPVARWVDAASRNTAWAGGRLELFWPVESGALSLGLWVPQASTWRPTRSIARDLGAEVGFEYWLP